MSNNGMNGVRFEYGALEVHTIEKQARAQGYTLGEKRDLMEDLHKALVMCWIHGILTDSQYEKGLNKLQKQVVQNLKRLEEGEKNAESGKH